MLNIKNISKSFGNNLLLSDISFNIFENKIYTLIGGNGSGKTTLLNMLTGFLKIEKGTINYNNILLNNKPPYLINILGISRTFQDLRLITKLTVKDNILLAFRKKSSYTCYSNFLMLREFQKIDNDTKIKANEILAKISLTSVADNYAGEISYGQQKLLTLGCCLANNPDLFLFDEPIAGIDSENYVKIKRIIMELKQDGNKTILQIEHNYEYIKDTTDEILYLDKGKMTVFKNYEEFNNKFKSEII